MPKMVTLPDGTKKIDRRNGGDEKLRWWLLISFAGIIVMGLGAFVKSTQADMKEISKEISGHSSRLVAVESTYVSVAKRLDRIEDKIDKLLTNTRSTPNG